MVMMMMIMISFRVQYDLSFSLSSHLTTSQYPRHITNASSPLLLLMMPVCPQELITGFCRQGRIDDALYVFDEWKGSVVLLPEEKRVGCSLNSAVLAFLEASCRKHEKYQWRVFDVTAIMRQQFETGKQSQLERPQKASHHFNSSLYEYDDEE